MDRCRPVTVVDIQERLITSGERGTNPLASTKIVTIDRLLVNAPISEWNDILEENVRSVMDTVATLVFAASLKNYTLQQVYRKTTGSNPFADLTFCDAMDCITKQMAQPLEFEDEFSSATMDIDYANECCPRIPFRRDGRLVGPKSMPRIEICIDCFFDSRTMPRIYLDQNMHDILLYGAIGFLVPDAVRSQLIADDKVYAEFTEDSTVADLGELVLKGISDNQFIGLLEVIVPVTN